MNSVNQVKHQTWNQTTLKRSVTLSGVGLHTGKTVTMTLQPAPANHGVVFLRTDLRERPQIKAHISSLVGTDMCTTLGPCPQSASSTFSASAATVATVEHLRAALRGLGVDNALIEISGPEVPIMDGSALVFAAAIADAGIKTHSVSRKVLRLKKVLRVNHQDKWIEARPSTAGLSIAGTIEFKHRIIGRQTYNFANGSDFLSDIAGARTFGFLKEVEYLRSKGLALGGSLDNAVVLDDNGVLNTDGLRFSDEFVRHKVLDAFGDFALLGLALEADVRIHKSGHQLHASLLSKIISNPQNFEILDLSKVGSAQEVSSEAMDFGLGVAVPA